MSSIDQLSKILNFQLYSKNPKNCALNLLLYKSYWHLVLTKNSIKTFLIFMLENTLFILKLLLVPIFSILIYLFEID